MAKVNRQFRLTARPVGEIKESDFSYKEEEIPTIGDGEMFVRNLYLSLDPTNRLWMSDQDQYMPPVELGAVMRGIAIAVVEESKSPQYKKGDFIWGLLGWQDYALLTGDDFQNVIPLDSSVLPDNKLTLYLGPMGMTGWTAYLGLLNIGKPQPGETVFVSGAAGSVGSMVGQIAKIKGCRVVGTAGSESKCLWLKEELGFDEAINYKNYKPGLELEEAIAKVCPNGIDVYFDNVGGSILDAVLTQVNLHARIPLCGLMSIYNAKGPVPGPYNYSQIMMKRVQVQGFIISDYFMQWSEAMTAIAQWIKEGKIKYSEETVDGLENAPKALIQLFKGTSKGKVFVKISEEP
ncbi:MAG: NADP-dependent oxidoreductase [Trichodesmium sp. MAG_R04]|nr:NADP-dependent oxidoreductase [Trichodesmium sp. MAG_R04]